MQDQQVRMWKQITAIVFTTFILAFVVAPLIEAPDAKPVAKTNNEEQGLLAVVVTGYVNINSKSSQASTLIKRAIESGGTLIQCLNNKCHDTATGQYFGPGQDNYYLIFPSGKPNTTKQAKEIAEEIKRMSGSRL
jgi:hypothetical protein